MQQHGLSWIGGESPSPSPTARTPALSSGQGLDRLPMRLGTGKLSTVLIVIAGLAACGTANPPGGIQFGPSSAENEIREAFGFGSEVPSYDELLRLAEAKNIDHETIEHDHSLLYCRINPREPGLRFEMFYAGRARNPRVTLNYVVVRNDSGAVVCIETRHGYPPL